MIIADALRLVGASVLAFSFATGNPRCGRCTR